jgi:hypothetical protein
VRRIDREARYFERIKDLDGVDPREAEARLNQLVADFNTLDQYLSDLIDRAEGSTTSASPLPIATPGTTPTALPAPSPKPAASPSPRP